ncbi:isoprenylcysteine carboxyl methyltransferase [Heliorestis acidaminivorans]|uniref:Isoprenylcysteine carboxyl methyltransferase n=1 Tax=Heliorestis acidaminivorans TaxID=553427 RepID=A0A6I0F249_9FIRM|nr:isoprenylcysteine carboxylmethyltransferase family protein [Heliorestis acidaminivorans]KAB2952543.1 isoprenylcysteine carboxyl methyltransferase [Heliorestis acidaminivorans]
MAQFFYVLFILLIVQRLGELLLAHRNGLYIVKKGGYEVGKEQYRVIVLLHSLFFVALYTEAIYLGSVAPPWWIVPTILFFLAQGLRYWAIFSLGPYWNTGIYVLPDAPVVTKGPYRYLRHPNYLVVMTELLTLPLIFGAYGTALIFTLTNAYILSQRIALEERALAEVTNYEKVMAQVPRLLPSKLEEAVRDSKKKV